MKVLVIGGGMGGLTACTSLRKFDKNVEITLIEPKDYIEIPWCSYRSIFDPALGEKSTFDINKWAVPKSVKHIRASVTKLTETEATLSNGHVEEFNTCVICSGAQTKFPALGRGPTSGKGKGSGTRDRRLAQMKKEGDKLLNAKSVLVVGGGLIGVETAGDLAHYAKQQNKSIKITLVHSQPHLVNEFSSRAAEMAKKKLEHLGIEVILNDKVIKEGNNVKLQKGGNGKVLDAEEIVWTTGVHSCNSFVDKKYKDKKGWLLVDEYFRVKGAENKFFAMGDCCDLLPNAGTQVLGTMNMLGKNISVALNAIESGETAGMERKMRKAMVQPEMYVATIGKQTGVALTPMCATQFFLPWIKQSTMFLFKPKGDLGLKS